MKASCSWLLRLPWACCALWLSAAAAFFASEMPVQVWTLTFSDCGTSSVCVSFHGQPRRTPCCCQHVKRRRSHVCQQHRNTFPYRLHGCSCDLLGTFGYKPCFEQRVGARASGWAAGETAQRGRKIPRARHWWTQASEFTMVSERSFNQQRRSDRCDNSTKLSTAVRDDGGKWMRYSSWTERNEFFFT